MAENRILVIGAGLAGFLPGDPASGELRLEKVAAGGFIIHFTMFTVFFRQ